MTVCISVELSRELLDEVGPFRPRANQSHVASKNIPKLRQLINRRRTQELADGPDPVISRNTPHRLRLKFIGWPHRAEFQQLKTLAITPDPHLPEDHARPTFNPNSNRSCSQHRRQDD